MSVNLVAQLPDEIAARRQPRGRVEVRDDLFCDGLAQKLFETVAWVPVYIINRNERYKSHELDIHWYYPLAVTDDPDHDDVEPELRNLDETLSPIVETWDRIRSAIGYDVRLYECMISANTFGTEGHPHYDINNRKLGINHLLALVYCNPKWELAWAGETVFFDESGEISDAVIPRPGRVVIAHGDPLHVGRSVSRICPYDRRVLVFKMWRTQ